jgi:hypothetical protein
MTYNDAVKKALEGYSIRHPGMGKGWLISKIENAGDKLWCINPHTRSNYLFIANKDDESRSDWAAQMTTPQPQTLPMDNGRSHR